MSNSNPKKTWIPHYGWFLAGTAGLVLSSWAVQMGLPVYREHAVIADLRRSGLTQIITVPRGPDWMCRTFGRDWSEKFGEARVLVVELRQEFTDRDLKSVARMPGLQDLDLGGTRITDSGLVNLHGLIQLQRLSLADTQVTDAGLVHLEALANLGVLILQGTAVTPARVAALRRSLPETFIVTP